MEIKQAHGPVFKLVYNGKDVTAELTPYISDITYTDRLTGQADELDVTVAVHDNRWLDAWYPPKGATLQYEFSYSQSKPMVSAGSFEVDEIEFNSPPVSVRIRALSAGLSRQVRTRIGKTYEKTTLKAIIETVAKRINAKVVGAVADIKIAKATQYQETEWAFLLRICREYGYHVKLTDNNKTLVVAKLTDLALQNPVRKLRPSDVTSWTYRDKITEVPAKTQVKHHDPKTKRLVKGEANTKQAQTSSDTRKRSIPAQSPAQAQALAQAEQERHEIDKTAMSLTLSGDATLVAGAAVELIEWSRLGGTYLITEASHSLMGGSVSIQCKRMKEPA